jgi:hypothetical protein
MVDKAIIIENKIKEIEKSSKRKLPLKGQSLGSNTRPHLPQLGPFFRSPNMVRLPDAWSASSIADAATKLLGAASKLLDAEASVASTSTQCAATAMPEHAARPSPHHSNLIECTSSKKP